MKETFNSEAIGEIADRVEATAFDVNRLPIFVVSAALFEIGAG
jgi:hypothetical protein